jgi:putative tricarboxylic transport membrane protein
MLEAFFQGWATVLQPELLLILFGATIVGIILGILPGVTGGFGIVVLLPFIIGLDPNIVLPIIIALSSTATIGGSLTSILIGIPGEPSNAATMLDGYPLMKKGQGLRALGAAATVCLVSNTGGIILALIMIPLVVPIVMQFKAAEMALMIIVGICFLAALTKGDRLKGIISAAMGILLATVGFVAKTGDARFTYGSLYLYDGIGLIVLIMGIFAMPAMIDMLSESPDDDSGAVTVKGMGYYKELYKGSLECLKHWALMARAAIMGYVIGLIPGLGGETAPWLALAHAKQSSKTPESFGTGNMEGIVAPEAANHAKEGGAILTTLALGIPGSGRMVLVMAAFVLVGIQPGPWVLTNHTALSFSMLQTGALTGIFAAILSYLAAPYLIKAVRVPTEYLFAALVPLIFVSVYANNPAINDLFVLVLVTIMAYFMRKYGFFLPALVLGFVLGKLFEYHLWQALDLVGPTFMFSSPIAIILLLCIPLILFFDNIRDLISRLRSGDKPQMEKAQ